MGKRPSKENVIALVEQYELVHPQFEAERFVRWAVKNKKWDRPSLRRFMQEWFAEQVATVKDYLRDDTITHAGKKIRSRLALRSFVTKDGKKIQKTLWARIDKAPIAYLMKAVEQLYDGLVDFASSYNDIVDYINDNRISKHGRKIPKQLNMTFLEEGGDLSEAG